MSPCNYSMHSRTIASHMFFNLSLVSIHEVHSEFTSFSSPSNIMVSPKYKSDIFLRIAMSILPIMAVITYQMDAIWQLHRRNMYAGLASTILHIFYFLQFYTHLKCHSPRITCVYTYLYHIFIWIFKVSFSVWFIENITMRENIFLDWRKCYLFLLSSSREKSL